jgi:hypothetical protein
VEHSQFAIALADADDDFFLSIAARVSRSPRSPSADVGFVHFDNAIKFTLVSFEHGLADAMAEIPRCFVGLDSQGSLNLAGRHAFLGLTEQHGGEKPRHKGQVRIVEDRIHRNAELVLA